MLLMFLVLRDTKGSGTTLPSEKECPFFRFGANCDRLCPSHCGGNGTCERYSGECLHGCLPGYFGSFCKLECDQNCGGDVHECDKLTGTCLQCRAGLTGEFCQKKCFNCIRDVCHKQTMECLQGCATGYTGPLCDEEITDNSVVPLVIFFAGLVLLAVILSTLIKKRRQRADDVDYKRSYTESYIKPGDSTSSVGDTSELFDIVEAMNQRRSDDAEE
ncbi:multiple epidermal growth factor-like domains protein 10 [Biomphalaria glabrata]|uniref:Multiple epidermal growth factor-like domains protein 10 n=1 Tax=Biomphalaria glabrata TaxID=6526 RepID=A0A9W2Z3U9_BIOGL|nr:multiple epidermal growth factor-like domains protein 10 [Biomphalaria glabrata]